MSEEPAGPRSRRQLLAVPLGGAVAALAAACGSTRPDLRKLPPAARRGEIAILNQGLDLEHMAIAAYTAGTPLLAGPARAAAQHFLDQELSHAGILAGLIKQAGGKSVKPAPGYNLGQPRSSAEVLRLLHRVEQAQIAFYLAAIPRLSPDSRAAVATVLANDAQHLSVLRARQRLDPLPQALVSSRE